MGKLLNAFVPVVFLATPVLSYLFLDQFYMRTFEDFGHKWLAREQELLKEQDLSDILKRYHDVMLVSDDLKGFGLVKGEKIAESFGSPSAKVTLVAPKETVSVARMGFFKYQTNVRLDPEGTAFVFFDFQDDTSVHDLAILMFSFISLLAFALVARARASQLRERTVKNTMVRTIQGMAHDFRAPFGRLRVFMTQLQSVDSGAFNQLKEYREEVDAAVAHADDILTDFLNLETKVSPTPFDCVLLAQRLETTYFRPSSRKNSTVSLEFDCEKGLWALGNEHKTLRILFNLLDNAVKHAESQVSLKIALANGLVKFQVTNDGAAIAKNQINAIFKPFYSRRKGGLGLGLFICDTFVRAQGGKLVCESQDNLTEFYFSLHVGRKPDEVTVKSEDSDKESHYLVAYVDDESFYQDALKGALKDSEIELIFFADTDSLLLEVKLNPAKYDLLLVDRFGPSFDAVEDRFDESCRDYGFKGPIVLYSNSVTGENELKGFSKVLDKVKPVSAQDLVNIIQTQA